LLAIALAEKQQIGILHAAFRRGRGNARHVIEPDQTSVKRPATRYADEFFGRACADIRPAMTDEAAGAASVGERHHLSIQRRADEIAARQSWRVERFDEITSGRACPCARDCLLSILLNAASREERRVATTNLKQNSIQTAAI
jgi:hypothetical protein